MNVTIQGESEEYRRLRNQLLEAEIALKDQTERVAALRRQLPTGPPIETDYVFREGPSDLRDDSPTMFRDVRLSELFAPGKDSLIVDHLMWAPNDELPCRMCNMWADGYSSIAQHVGDKVNFVLVAKVELGRLRDWGRRRGWGAMRLLSSHDNTFNRDYFVEDERDNGRPSACSDALPTAKSISPTRRNCLARPAIIAASTRSRPSGTCSICFPKDGKTGCPGTSTVRTRAAR